MAWAIVPMSTVPYGVWQDLQAFEFKRILRCRLSSVTEREIQLGLMASSSEKRQLCTAFVRHIKDIEHHLSNPRVEKWAGKPDRACPLEFMTLFEIVILGREKNFLTFNWITVHAPLSLGICVYNAWVEKYQRWKTRLSCIALKNTAFLRMGFELKRYQV